jgi:hypothetical protein
MGDQTSQHTCSSLILIRKSFCVQEFRGRGNVLVHFGDYHDNIMCD